MMISDSKIPKFSRLRRANLLVFGFRVFLLPKHLDLSFKHVFQKTSKLLVFLLVFISDLLVFVQRFLPVKTSKTKRFTGFPNG